MLLPALGRARQKAQHLTAFPISNRSAWPLQRILAIIGLVPITLILAGLLGLGASVFLSGSTMSSTTG
jgi:hypothetical protein